MADYTVSYGVFTGKINAGVLAPDGRSFQHKSECTEAALMAVANHALNQGGSVDFRGGPGKRVRITVEVVDDDER